MVFEVPYRATRLEAQAIEHRVEGLEERFAVRCIGRFDLA
jgi:hypothetical protein